MSASHYHHVIKIMWTLRSVFAALLSDITETEYVFEEYLRMSKDGQPLQPKGSNCIDSKPH